MTLVKDPPAPAVADDPQLLFAEAKERRKRRWVIGGIVTAVVGLLLVLVAIGTARSDSRGPSTHPSATVPFHFGAQFWSSLAIPSRFVAGSPGVNAAVYR